MLDYFFSRGNTPIETCYGIDLNRNFDFHWDNAGGASAAGCSGYYRGDKPFSEPESRSIESFIIKRLVKQHDIISIIWGQNI